MMTDAADRPITETRSQNGYALFATYRFRRNRSSQGDNVLESSRMNIACPEWEKRVADLWASMDDYDPDEFVKWIEVFAAELPPDSAIGLFERGAAQDSTGHPDRAVPLYQAALTAGLIGVRRRRACIQLASSLRNLGNAQHAADLLTAELQAPGDELDDAVRAFLALALVDLGREREAVAVSLTALSRHLPRYNRSLACYAQQLAGAAE
jgi:tetratricopeptide (TPR) repeat protein